MQPSFLKTAVAMVIIRPEPGPGPARLPLTAQADGRCLPSFTLRLVLILCPGFILLD